MLGRKSEIVGFDKRHVKVTVETPDNTSNKSVLLEVTDGQARFAINCTTKVSNRLGNRSIVSSGE